MPSEVERAFFNDCVSFVKKIYGEENIIFAVVHKMNQRLICISTLYRSPPTSIKK